MNNSRLNNKIKRESWAATKANASLNNLSPTDVDALIAQYLIDNPVGGGGLPQLAPDLLYISENVTVNTGFKRVALNAVGALTTALSLTGGKFAISSIGFQGTAAEVMTVKLTVDGVVIINDTFTATQYGICVIGAPNGAPTNTLKDIGTITCNSLLLQLQTTTDTNVLCSYIVRPIL